MGRRPDTKSTTNVEYSACSWEELKTSSGETPFVLAHSAMLGTTFIMGADGGGVLRSCGLNARLVQNTEAST